MSASTRASFASRCRSIAALAFLTLASFANAAPLSGTLTGVGSDTLGTVVARWAEAFRAREPGVQIQLQTPGSASAPIALMAGSATFGPMSRAMTPAEIAAFRARFGHDPAVLIVARDAIVVFVHPDNPLTSLQLSDLDAIYSSSHACGHAAAARAWRDVGAADASLASTAILPIGRNGASGTYAFFRDVALCGGRYRPDVVEWPGAGAIVAAVSNNRGAIGYAGIGYVNGLVRPLALRDATTGAPVTADAASVRDGRYPLARPLYIYFNREPGRPLPDLLASFLRYILSADGRTVVEQEGFVALTSEEADGQLADLH